MNRAILVFATLVAGAVLAVPACSSNGGTASNSHHHGGTGGSGGAGTGGGAGDASFNNDQGASCTSGQPCGDGGICAGGKCCAASQACGNDCCASGQVCSFNKCETPGKQCADSSDCAPDEYCEYALGNGADAGAPDSGASDGGSCVGGAAVKTGRCLPKPPICAGGADAGAPDAGAGQNCLEKCEYHPPTTAFDPVVKYSWGGDTSSPYSSDVMMTPIVVELDDDNCDGKVTADDIPEIVFSTFSNGRYYGPGTLHIISVVGGKVVDKLSKPNAVQASGGLAAGDLDGDGVAEIVGCMAPAPGGTSCCDAQAENTGVVAYKADGSVLWTQTDTTKVHCGYEAPAIADPDHTGHPMVLVGTTLLDGQTGAVVKQLDPSSSYGVTLSSFADVDGDGKLDVVDGRRAWHTDGTVIWDLSTGPNAIPAGYHAVGDLDKDGKPEVVVISSGAPHKAYVLSYDPTSASHVKVIRNGVDINDGTSTATYCGASSEYGGGPPTIADFDGDGYPDVGAAGAVGYVVFSGKKLMDPAVPDNQTTLWFKTTHDCSSAVTGSSVFDFNGDGKAEVVYSDEYHLWMYDGQTGNNLIPTTCNTTGTLWEYPVIADVDNDGQADIVVASNAYAETCNGTKQSGIRIFGSQSKSWVRTRRVWNEHTYHITNINEDGTVPVNEPTNWTTPGLNNFRQNKQPGGEFDAADAVVTVSPKCGGGYGLIATVRNLGQAVLPPGVTVTFYSGNPPSGTALGTGATTHALYPAQAEQVVLPLPNAPPDVQSGKTPVYAAVDVPPPTHECRTDNNTSAAVSAACNIPQ